MDNATLARLLTETGDLLEISGGDSFRMVLQRASFSPVQDSSGDN